MVNVKKTKYLKTHRVEDLDSIFFERPTKKWIESKLLPCFNLKNLDDRTEISRDLTEQTIPKIEELTGEIAKYLQLIVVKRSFCRHQNTFYKCIIILKYFANLYGYTIQRRLQQINDYTNKIQYSLISTNYLRDCDFIEKPVKKKYIYKPLIVIPEKNGSAEIPKIPNSIYKKKHESIKISFD